MPPKLIFYNGVDYGFHIPHLGTLSDSLIFANECYKKFTFESLFEKCEHKRDILVCYQIYLEKNIPDMTDLINARNYITDKYFCIHSNLTYNLCGSVNHRQDPKFVTKLEYTCKNLTKELDIGAFISDSSNSRGVVTHIGSCVDKEKGMYTISKSIENVMTRITPITRMFSKQLKIKEQDFILKRKIILENSAGEGNKLGSTLDEISQILSQTEYKNQIRVCIDTAHIFGAGQYDFGLEKSVISFFKDFDEKIGLQYLELFHLNDSREKFNSKKDRHAHIGKGYIFGKREDDKNGLLGLKTLLILSEKYNIKLIGEPPSENIDEDYKIINEIYPFIT